jgi:fructosamine-3-kinase
MNVMEKELRERIDPHLTAENLSELASKALGEAVRAGSARIMLGGCWNRVIEVDLNGYGRCVVFKISPRERDRSLVREFSVLQFFKGHTEFPVPAPLLIDESGEAIPGTVLVMERVPGTVLHQALPRLTDEMRISIIEQVGHLVGRLHGMRSTGFGGVELAEGDRFERWQDFWLPRFDAVFVEITGSGIAGTDLLRRVESVRHHFDSLLNTGSVATLLHYDIWYGNIMVDVENGEARVSGFVDVQGYWGDYARELSFMELFGTAPPELYAVYREYRRIDEDMSIRKDIYNLKMNLKHMVMYPGEGFYIRGAHDCLRNIEYAAEV